MSSILVGFVSTCVETERIGGYVARLAHGRRLGTRTVDLARAHGADPSDYGATIIVAPVYFGHHSRAVARFMRSHAGILSTRPTAFVSVSKAAASGTPAARANAEQIARDFVSRTRVCGCLVTTVGGAVAHGPYAALARVIVSLKPSRLNGHLDTVEGTDFTDLAAMESELAPFFGPLERRKPSRAQARSRVFVDRPGVQLIL
ncbi:MAG TPA: flavodoxin domain-containing protein [Labilithrix sp.]|nr:flavodoxin domain-containing protein [Labilithrix sp.]